MPVYINATLENTSLGILISIFDTLNGYLSAPSPIAANNLSRWIGDLLQQKNVDLLLALDAANYLCSGRALIQVPDNFTGSYLLVPGFPAYPPQNISLSHSARLTF